MFMVQSNYFLHIVIQQQSPTQNKHCRNNIHNLNINPTVIIYSWDLECFKNLLLNFNIINYSLIIPLDTRAEAVECYKTGTCLQVGTLVLWTQLLL